MPEGNGSGWRTRAASTDKPPVLDQKRLQAFNQEMFNEVHVSGLLDPEGFTQDEQRRIAGAALSYSERLTRALIKGYVSMGEEGKVKEVERQATELDLITASRTNHNTLYLRESLTLQARKEDLQKEVNPLVVALRDRVEQARKSGVPDIKGEDAWAQVQLAMNQDEQDKKDTSKLKQQGRNEGLAVAEDLTTQLQELRLHLQQKEKQVEFLTNRVNQLESLGAQGGAAKDPQKGRLIPR